MSAANQMLAIERILVAVDASPASLTALEAAVELAARLNAELIGIFVEDINLVRLAGFEFSREIGYFSASVRTMDSPRLERQLRAQARAVQQVLRRLAEQLHVHWSFRVVRGAIPTELLAAAVEADLVVLGKVGWSGRRGLGSTAQVVVKRAPGKALIFHHGVSLGMPILAIYDGTEEGEKSLEATRLIWTEGSLLTVLILADDLDEASLLQSQAHNWLHSHNLEAQYRWLIFVNTTTLAHQVRSEGCGLLVLPVNSPRLSDEVLEGLMSDTSCAVLVVR
jgi:nucleotide-binding universal stress UspA family protein